MTAITDAVPDTETLVQAHYGRGDILERIFAALRRAAIDPDAIGYLDVAPFDQLHARGLDATRDHLRESGIHAGMHVLDLGCGIGGSARYVAATTGCRVMGIDLTREYIEVADELTRRCGLGAQISYRRANALDLPFASATFDHVWCHNVTMNIADKARLAAEIARVLQPHGRVSCSEMARGPAGDPVYPLPWASNASSSFLLTPEEMRSTLAIAGLRIIKHIDLTQAHLSDARTRMAEDAPPANQPIMGDDVLTRVRNSARGMMEGRLVEHLLVAEREIG